VIIEKGLDIRDRAAAHFLVHGTGDPPLNLLVEALLQHAQSLGRSDDGERFEVATEHLVVSDTTGAGDAFDAGFLVGWFAARAAGRSLPAALQRAAIVGHRAAARQLTSPRPELPLG